MKNILILCIVVILFTQYSCISENRKVHKHIKEINTQYNLDLDELGWSARQPFKRKVFTEYTVTKRESDTLIKLVYRHYNQINKYEIDQYEKSYWDKNAQYNYYVELDVNLDTLYYYRTSDPTHWIREFMIGGYYFKYRNDLLTKGQKKYYKLHKDSLMRVRGNDLPPLPER